MLNTFKILAVAGLLVLGTGTASADRDSFHLDLGYNGYRDSGYVSVGYGDARHRLHNFGYYKTSYRSFHRPYYGSSYCPPVYTPRYHYRDYSYGYRPVYRRPVYYGGYYGGGYYGGGYYGGGYDCYY